MFGGMGVVSIIFWLIFLAGIFLVLRALLDRKSGPDTLPPPPPAETALGILEKRFAKGEIDEDTFKRMKKDLEE